ncbi:hypothetical protein BP00DRAFT_64679 [Aspergillus indologenus CBS 114.80]|uniref:Uncharacterized protein n=1 Tax=Aspergillus indologenus CBS 114.80 TaxID=1450541 RepID=A0A2V5IE36_9EURO|nr:hypothetical protein BP00DRAFT_64679 [Aspergillus indologenus CBS 114.80]
MEVIVGTRVLLGWMVDVETHGQVFCPSVLIFNNAQWVVGWNGSDRGSALVGFDWSVGCVPGSSKLQPSELPGVTGAAVAGQGFLLLRKMVGLRVMIFIPGDCREKSIGDASEWVRTRLEDRDFIMTEVPAGIVYLGLAEESNTRSRYLDARSCYLTRYYSRIAWYIPSKRLMGELRGVDKIVMVTSFQGYHCVAPPY